MTDTATPIFRPSLEDVLVSAEDAMRQGAETVATASDFLDLVRSKDFALETMFEITQFYAKTRFLVQQLKSYAEPLKGKETQP